MNPEKVTDAVALFTFTKNLAQKTKHITIILAPSILHFVTLRRMYKGSKLRFAIQSARAEITGAHTGNVSLNQACNSGASYAIIGHAERRAQGETNDDVRQQISVAYGLGMIPILCIGETKRSGENEHLLFIREQLAVGCRDIPPTKIGSIVIAYEPVWAIGGKKPMEPHDMHEMAIFIRKTLNELYGPRAMQATILYGGSIDEMSVGPMLEMGDVAGLLVGRASIDATVLPFIIQACETI
jgi:triosephosphate isomerase